MTDAEMESFIDRLGNEKKRSLDDVRDFSFVRQAWRELEGKSQSKLKLSPVRQWFRPALKRCSEILVAP